MPPCYKHCPAYQPFNVYWAEQQAILNTEFRDGNVPAGYQQLRVLKESLTFLPPQGKRARTRSDTAGYPLDLMRYYAPGEDPRFGKIEFAFSCDVTPSFKMAVSEVKGAPEYRYLATRELLAEQELPGLAPQQQEMPFPTMDFEGNRYKIFGIVTNMDWEGEKLSHWQHERCGKSEEAHAVLKNDLAGGRLPSQLFGANAAWWWLAVLAFNLNSIMKRRVLGRGFAEKRLKAIRFLLINLPGRVLERARRLIVRLVESPMATLLLEVRCRILGLVRVSAG